MNDIGGTIIIVLDGLTTSAQTTRFSTRSLVRDKDYVNDDVYPSIIGISNDLQWRDNLDPAAKDSLYDDSIFFCALRCERTPRYPFPPCKQGVP